MEFQTFTFIYLLSSHVTFPAAIEKPPTYIRLCAYKTGLDIIEVNSYPYNYSNKIFVLFFICYIILL